MNPTKAGRLIQRLYLQAPAYPETFDTLQQPIQTWNTLGIFWGEVNGLKGVELINAKQIKGQATIQIKTRYLGAGIAISPEKRFVLGDRMVATATAANGSSTVTLSQSTVIQLQSWVLFPYSPGSLSTPIGDDSLQVYQIIAGSGTSYTISPAYGGSLGGAGLTIATARFLGLTDTTNMEERNKEYNYMAYEIQTAGPI